MEWTVETLNDFARLKGRDGVSRALYLTTKPHFREELSDFAWAALNRWFLPSGDRRLTAGSL